MDFYQSIYFLLFSLASLFSLHHIPLFVLSIFRALLGHDKSRKDVMTQAPLLALGERRKNKWEKVGGREKKRWKRFVWKWLLTRHWFCALISHSVLKFPITEMEKRSEREMGLAYIGREVKLGMSLSVSLGRQNIRSPYSGKKSNVLYVYFFKTCAALLLDH